MPTCEQSSYFIFTLCFKIFFSWGSCSWRKVQQYECLILHEHFHMYAALHSIILICCSSHHTHIRNNNQRTKIYCFSVSGSHFCPVNSHQSIHLPTPTFPRPPPPLIYYWCSGHAIITLSRCYSPQKQGYS